MPTRHSALTAADPDLGVALIACALLLATSSLASVTAAIAVTLLAATGTGVILGLAGTKLPVELRLPILAVLVAGFVSAGTLVLMALAPGIDVSSAFVMPVVAGSALALASHTGADTGSPVATPGVRRWMGAFVMLAAALVLWAALRERLAVPAAGGLVFLSVFVAAHRAWRARSTA